MPPCSQCWMWWPCRKRVCRQPGKRQPRSRTHSARRMAGGIGTAFDGRCPGRRGAGVAGAVRVTTRPASQAMRRKRFRGNAGAVVQGGGHLAVGGERVLVQVDEHLVAVGAAAAGAVGLGAGRETRGPADDAVGAGGGDGALPAFPRKRRRPVLRLRGCASRVVPRLLDRLQDQGGLVGAQGQLQADHAAGQVALAYAALLGRWSLSHLDRLSRFTWRNAAADALELRAGRVARELQQAGFVLGRGHPGEGADLGVRQLAAGERLVDMRAASRARGPPGTSRARSRYPGRSARTASGRRRPRPAGRQPPASSNWRMQASSRCVAASTRADSSPICFPPEPLDRAPCRADILIRRSGRAT